MATNHLGNNRLVCVEGFHAKKVIYTRLAFLPIARQSPLPTIMTTAIPTRWYVMTHLEMNRFKRWLDSENAEHLRQGEVMCEPFYPSEFLCGESADGAVDRTNRDARALASDLQRFAFLKSTREDIDGLIESEKSLGYRTHLRYYTAADGSKATVSDQMMTDFFDACLKYRGYFEVLPVLHGIEATDKVKINVGPFAGREASVVRVQHSNGEIHLELALELVNGALIIRMPNVRRDHVSILNRSAVDAIRADFIEYTQTHLLTILEHRVKGITDEAVRQRDVAMLTRLYRYRHHHVENRAAQIHFQALMLICAHLCRYAADEEALTEQALASLAEINRKSESKAATDTRAYLWIALYIVTRDPAYRDALKQYVRDHQPKSERLRHFVTLIRTGKKL